MSHLTHIVDPDHSVRAYLHQRRLLQAFNVLNIFIEIMLVIFYISGFEDALYNYTWDRSKFLKKDAIKVQMDELFIGITVFNLLTLLFGFYTISKHNRTYHCFFKMFLIISITAGLTVCSKHLINMFSVIPRVLLLMYTVFVGNCLLPAALTINLGDNYDSGMKSSLYNKVPNHFDTRSRPSLLTNSTQKENLSASPSSDKNLHPLINQAADMEPKKEIFTKKY